jgi:GNAT superfamily N-acetyltransferase
MLVGTHGAPSPPPQSPEKLRWDWEIVNEKNPNLAVMQSFHKGIIEKYFLESEREEASLWEEQIIKPDPKGKCKWSLVAALKPVFRPPVDSSEDEETDPKRDAERKAKSASPAPAREVAGGAVLELYVGSQCALLPYIGIDEEYRGKGLSSELLRKAIFYLTEACHDLKLPPYKALFLEVLQARDDDHEKNNSGTDAKTRQIIWQKMGIEPIEGLDLIHPGRMNGGHRYHLCVYVGTGRFQTDIGRVKEIEVSVVLAFVHELFYEILRAEGKEEDTSEFEQFAAQYKGRMDQKLRIGPDYWL